MEEEESDGGNDGLAVLCLQISAGEQRVVESKPDNVVEDLRLHQPWPELAEYAASIDLASADEHTHRHTPYGVCTKSKVLNSLDSVIRTVSLVPRLLREVG